MDTDIVAQAIRFAHAETIAPYFGRLKADGIEYKSPGEVVTVADRQCEQLLGELLRDVIDAPVLGEEGVAANPTLLDEMPMWDSAWLLDPIDGTASFAKGEPYYAVMVAFVQRQQTVASWIFQPEFDHMAIAVRGSGATLDDQVVVTPEPEQDPASWTGVLKDRFLPEAIKDSVESASEGFGQRHHVSHCAGFEYPALVAGEHSYLLYWRTLPWDHAPGVLYAEEAGCLSFRPDCSQYAVHDNRNGLVVAHSAIAAEVVTRLLGGSVD
ncbi:MAG: inositol monophosphatase family protein [Acidimicrobiales bacterium]